MGCVSRVRRKFGWKPQPKSEYRTVFIGASRQQPRNGAPVPGLTRQESAVWSQERDDSHTQQKFPTNVIKSSKYTVFNFLPKNLFEQFRRIANFYFLCMAVVQLTVTSPVEPITSVFPLVFVIGITMLKQGYEDYLRHVADRQVNNRVVFRLSHHGRLEKVRSKDLRVGDIIYTPCDHKFPCDAVLLASSEPDAKAQVQTANLDGETSLKVIKAPAIPEFQLAPGAFDELDSEQLAKRLKVFRAQLECEQPTSDLYRFRGNIHCIDTFSGDKRIISVSEKNLLLGGARLKNTGFTFSTAVYTGRDSKMALNSIYQANKFSALERTMNRFLLCCFVILAIEITLATVLKIIFITTSPTGTAWYFLDSKTMFYNTPIYGEYYVDDVSSTSNLTSKPRSVTGQVQRRLWPQRPIFGSLFNTTNTGLISSGIGFGGSSTSSAAFLNQTRPATSLEVFGRVVENLLSFVILFNVIIPISLYVTVECQRFLGSRFIQWDVELYDDVRDLPAKVNSSDLNEALGQVEYLFTDKTGTLTENDMRFRKCTIRGIKYEEKRSSGFLIREKLGRIVEPIGQQNSNADSPCGSQNSLLALGGRTSGASSASNNNNNNNDYYYYHRSNTLGSQRRPHAHAHETASSETDGDLTDGDVTGGGGGSFRNNFADNKAVDSTDEVASIGDELDERTPHQYADNNGSFNMRQRSNTGLSRRHERTPSKNSAGTAANRRKSSAALLDLSSVDIYSAMRQDKDFELFILALVLCHCLYVSRKTDSANAAKDDEAAAGKEKKPSLASVVTNVAQIPVQTLRKANEYVIGDKNPIKRLVLGKIEEEHPVEHFDPTLPDGIGGGIILEQDKKRVSFEVNEAYKQMQEKLRRDGMLAADERDIVDRPSVFIQKKSKPLDMRLARSGTAHGPLVKMKSIAMGENHLFSSSTPDVNGGGEQQRAMSPPLFVNGLTAVAAERQELGEFSHTPTLVVMNPALNTSPTPLHYHPHNMQNGAARFSTIQSQVDDRVRNVPRCRPKHARSASMSARGGMKSLFYAPQDVPRADDLTYEGASPDEKALVEACARMGVFFLGQLHEQPGVVAVKVRGEAGLRRYKILHTLEFDNNRRRMSVVVKRVYNKVDPNPPSPVNGLGGATIRPNSSASTASGSTVVSASTVEFASNSAASAGMNGGSLPPLAVTAAANFLASLDTISEVGSEHDPLSRQASRDTAIGVASSSSLGVPPSRQVSVSPAHVSPDSSFHSSNSSRPPQQQQQPINNNSSSNSATTNNQTSHRDEILMLVKGADSGVLPIGGRGEVELTSRHVDDYSMTGLRCLVIGYKTLTENEYCAMKAELGEAEQTLDANERDQRMSNIYKKWESNLHVLGATAVEDRLQDHVHQTLRDLRNAGIKVWVLTGDKLDTAVQIANACGHFQRGMRELRLVGLSDKTALRQKMMEIIQMVEGGGSIGGPGSASLDAIREAQHVLNSSQSIPAYVEDIANVVVNNKPIVPFRGYWMVIDGVSLTSIFQDAELELLLTRACLGCVAVLTCRCAPLQKAQVVRMIKDNKITKTQPITAAIGDGANDVSMIQEAHVGIGIMGKEGRQAARSADFAMSRFHHLRRMLLVHGHWFYIRIAVLVNYFFYKNFAMVTPQLYYTFENGYSQQSLYDSFFLTFYNMLFSTLPILMFGLIEQRWSEYTLLRRPALYKVNARNCRLSWAQFFKWNTLGVWHATACYYGGRFLWTFVGGGIEASGKTSDNASFGAFVSIAVILVVNFRLALETRYWTIPTIGGFIFTFFIFFATNFLYTGFLWVPLVEHADYFYVFISVLGSPLLVLGLVVLTVASLLPDFVFVILERQSDHRAYMMARREGGGISGRAGRLDGDPGLFGAPDVMQKSLTGGSMQHQQSQDGAAVGQLDDRSTATTTHHSIRLRRQEVLVPIVDTVMINGIGGVVRTTLTPAPAGARAVVSGEELSSNGQLFPSLNPDKRSTSVYDGLAPGTSIHDAEPIVRGGELPAASPSNEIAPAATDVPASKRRRGERPKVASKLSNPFAFRLGLGRKSATAYDVSPAEKAATKKNNSSKTPLNAVGAISDGAVEAALQQRILAGVIDRPQYSTPPPPSSETVSTDLVKLGRTDSSGGSSRTSLEGGGPTEPHRSSPARAQNQPSTQHVGGEFSERTPSQSIAMPGSGVATPASAGTPGGNTPPNSGSYDRKNARKQVREQTSRSRWKFS